MPGKIRKARVSRPVTTSRPTSSPPRVTRRPAVAPRIKTEAVRRSTNVRRTQQRNIKRQQVREVMQQTTPRPRPVVRPTTRPRKVMPKQSPPPTSSLKSLRRQVRPPAPSPRRTTIRPQTRPGPRPAVVAAAGAAAVGGALITLNIAAAHPDIAVDVTSLNTTLTDLHNRSSFSSIKADLTNLDSDINHVLNLLESARDKGYVYQGDMEEITYSAVDSWQSVREQVEASISQQAQSMQTTLATLNPQVQRLNSVLRNPTSAAPVLSSTQTQINQVMWDLQRIENTLEDSYDEIESTVAQLNARLTKIHWALDQLDEAKFKLEKSEDLVMAVPARWDQEGKDDPEGILYLTNQRLIFERKEKVATKKVLFVTTSKELVHEVQIDQPLSAVKKTKAQNKGLFGHQDFMDVEFSDRSLGDVAFHLNGQDSEDWVNLIARAKSGAIEEERATGSGLSFADLTGPLTSGDLLSLQNEVNELQDEMMLKDVESDLADLENEVRSLERDLADLRARGYAVEKSLEADIRVLAAQWDRIKTRSEATMEHQTKLLSQQMTTIQDDLAKLMGMSSNLDAARPSFVRLKSAVASAEAQADAAEDTVLDQYDEYADEVESLSVHFDWVDWMLDALSTASFQLLATESAVAATEAIWERPGLEPENGILFLTDQRLLWEDRVGDFELKIDIPIQQVSDVKEISEEDAEFEVLSFGFDASDAPVSEARFQLSLPVAEEWLQMVGRARAGDYTQDRAIPLDEEELERIRNAPQQCSNCGAAFTAPVLRGQNEIICEFCGVVTRI
jgi:predicted  nucleic acid-binding Zn-ribbon protein